MKSLLRLQVNGEPVQLAVPDHWTLLEALRYELGLTGTKQGCDKGDCGACTVLSDGQPVLSCCMLARAAEGHAITTIEGLATPEGPDPVQRAFDVSGALQCGFCQPGMILSAKALLARSPDPSDAELREALSGNLCRCTGYTKIFEAVRLAARGSLGGPFPRHAPLLSGPPAEGFLVLGARGRKADSIAKATGEAVYADDIVLPRMAHGKILRSPHAHARILSIDTSAASAMPGVFAVLVGSELPTPFCVIPWTPDETALAIGKVRYVGEGVAAVAAVDEDTANAACAAIKVVYEPLPAVIEPAAALAPGAPLVHEVDWKGRPWENNVCKEVDLSFGEVDAGFAAAAAITEGQWFYEGSTHAPIEPHCALATWSPDGQLTMWSASQVTHYLHRELAHVLGIPTEKIRVIQPVLGGAFGGKSEPFDLEFCVAALAKKAGRPVKILYTREEVFYSHRGRHPADMRFKVGCDADGKITAVESDITLDGGAYHSFGLVTAYYAGQLLAGPTAFGSYRFKSRRVYTNKPCCGPKRGHGSVQPRFAFETALDEVAEKLDIDPIEIRRRNAMKPGDRTINGQLVPSTGLGACLDAVAGPSNWTERHGKLPRGRGLGVACSMYISGTAYPVYPNEMPQSGVMLRGDRGGKITVFCGANDIGQGSDGMLAYIVAEETGVPPDDITVVSADTDLVPVDLGAYSSRVTYMCGIAAQEAARNMRKRMVAAVAVKLAIAEEQVLVALGSYHDKADPGRMVKAREALILAEAAAGVPLVETGGYRTRKVGGEYRGGTIGASPAYSTTAHVCEVTVDEETGIVRVEKVWAAHDCGRALNPTMVEGQIEGSVYMGYAEALMEAHTFDERGLHSGPNLLDYRIPTSAECPDFFAKIIETIDPGGPYGAKEAGEGPLHPIIPAIANAIYDAVGIRLRRLPFTPDRVLAAIRERDAAAAGATSNGQGAAC
jgi:4-hydroxybenzoyl-CoA reductase subunit alpha